jgi:hypothetical protein
MKPLLMSDKDALKCGKQRIAAFGDRISLIKVNHFKSPLKRLKKPKTTLKVSRIRVTCSDPVRQTPASAHHFDHLARTRLSIVSRRF